MITSFVALDLETTGTNPKIDRIIEIGMALYKNGELIKTYKTLINPGITIDARITELTGITNSDVAGKPRISEVIAEVVEFIGDEPILGHNVIFDYSFLKKAATNNGLSVNNQGIDTLKMARRILPELPHRNLSYLCDHFGIDAGNSHRAFDDAISAAKVYEAMRAIKPQDGGYEEPFELVYAVKKDQPITNPQKSYLKALVEKHGVELDIPLDEMTKSMASRKIDSIISEYGK